MITGNMNTYNNWYQNKFVGRMNKNYTWRLIATHGPAFQAAAFLYALCSLLTDFPS